MPITTLDPVSALIVVDLQGGLSNYPGAHPISGVVANAALLAEAFRAHGLPVVLVNVDGGAPGRTEQAPRGGTVRPAGWTELMPELHQQPSDHTVTKRTWGAFTNTDLDTHLKSLGVTQVVVVGIATTAGVESTARHAHENGFNVTLPLDAMTDGNAQAHENSATLIFPRIGETGSTQDVLDLLG